MGFVMSRKRFDEFYNFDGCMNSLEKKLSEIRITGTSTTRQLGSGGFFFGVHDRDNAANKRLAVVFESREASEKVYDLIFGGRDE